LAPSAQFTPTEKGRACSTEVQKASTVCPLSVRPEASVMVTESSSGTSTPRSSSRSRMAAMAALQFRVSKTVSTSSTSAPPSSRPRACSW
jgi:hypothetical protein